MNKKELYEAYKKMKDDYHREVLFNASTIHEYQQQIKGLEIMNEQNSDKILDLQHNIEIYNLQENELLADIEKLKKEKFDYNVFQEERNNMIIMINKLKKENEKLKKTIKERRTKDIKKCLGTD